MGRRPVKRRRQPNATRGPRKVPELKCRGCGAALNSVFDRDSLVGVMRMLLEHRDGCGVFEEGLSLLAGRHVTREECERLLWHLEGRDPEGRVH